MGWGVELWDKQAEIEKRTQDGIDFISNVRNFAAKVAEIERESASKLQALVKAFPVHSGNSGFAKSWKDVVGMVDSTAKAREASSVALLSEVCQPLKTLIKDKTAERTEYLSEIARLHADLAKHAQIFEKKRKVYEKVEKDMVTAKSHFDKLEGSDASTKKKVDAARREYANKAQSLEDAERQLKEDLDKFNRERTVIFHSNKPSCFDALQRLDESRAETVVNHLGQLVTCMQTSLDTSVQAANAAQATCQAFDKGADSTLFIQAIGSGLPLPPDVTIPEVLERNPKDGKRAPMSAVASASPKLQRANPPASQPAPAAQASTPATPAQAQSAPEQGSPKAGGGGPPPPPPKPKPAAAGPPQVRMLYDFAGTNDGELPSSANEMVFLMQDDGSGWALVAKSDGTQGYIPSSYYQRV